jgi:tRNA nucleotidyltransferase (CCA-adding enzyme)
VTELRPTVPPAVRWIARTLEGAGYETWAVGGAVRDALLGQPTKDWDLATRATPAQMRKVFRRTVPIGIEHGTVGVLSRDGTLYEVTTFRRDVETDGRHAIVEFADSIEDDLSRRDFTINAIAWHPIREEAYDPFDGARDLERRRLTTVGVPEERFREDYLRILRGLRFAGRFGLEIEEETWSALCELVVHLPSLSAERVRDELLKVVGDDEHPIRALELYGASGALRVLYAELDAVRLEEGEAQPPWPHTLATVAALPRYRSDLRLAALMRPLAPAAAAAVLSRLRLSNALTDQIAGWAAATPMPTGDSDDAAARRWLSAHGPDRLAPLARLELAGAQAGAEATSASGVVQSWTRLRHIRRSAPPLSVDDLALDGRELIRLGLKPGPEFGRILEGLLDWVLDDPARNDAQTLEQRVLQMVHEESGGV